METVKTIKEIEHWDFKRVHLVRKKSCFGIYLSAYPKQGERMLWLNTFLCMASSLYHACDFEDISSKGILPDLISDLWW